MAELTDLKELTRNTPGDLNGNTSGQPDRNMSVNPNPAATTEKQADHARRHAEHEAMKAARRAGERERNDENGNDEFSNIGPA